MGKREKISPLIFKTEEKTYRVIQKKWGDNDFDTDYAYLMSHYNDYVYPYRGKVDKIEYAHQVGLYSLKKKGKLIPFLIRPKTERDKKIYNKSRIIELTPDVIFMDLKDDINEVPEISIAEGDVFNPAITNNDDIALAGMKFAIGKKQIDFNAYGHRFDSTATKNNGRRALLDGKTLKMEMMTRFCDVFDINAGLFFWDKEGCSNPMTKDGTKTVYVIFNDDEIDLADRAINFEIIEKK